MNLVDVPLIQPLHVVIDLDIGGISIRQDAKDTPIGLKYTALTDTAGTVTIQLFDKSGKDIEPYLWTARDKNHRGSAVGKFRFGYTAQEEHLSPWYDFTLLGYTSDFTQNGFMLVLTGQVPAASSNISTNQYEGTFKECIDKFAKSHNYTVQYYPPVDESKILERDTAGSSTELKTKIFRKSTSESDHSFILKVISYARSSEGKGGYRAYFGNDKDGQKILRIVLAENANNISQYQFTIQEKKSGVISWRPEVNFGLISVLGKDEIFVNSTQDLTGDDQKLVLTREVTQQFQSKLEDGDVSSDIESTPSAPDAKEMLYFNSEGMPPEVTSRGVRNIGRESSNPYSDINPALNKHLKAQLAGNRATLILLGQPNIVPLTQADVVFYYPEVPGHTSSSHERHYTSGKYFITQVVHEVVVGSFTTTLSMIRADLYSQPKL